VKEFGGFDHLSGEVQREGMKGWGPSAHPVVEPVLFRYAESGGELEILVCRRLKGALSVANPPACTTSNPGGHHVLVGTDDTPVDAVIRSIHMKLGYSVVPARMSPVGTFGPAINRSSLEIAAGKVRLVIHDEPAEPDAPFLAHVIAVNASRLRKNGVGNGSLEEVGWFALANLVDRFGRSKNHIYFQFLFQFLRRRSRSLKAPPLELAYPDWRAGVYELELKQIELCQAP